MFLRFGVHLHHKVQRTEQAQEEVGGGWGRHLQAKHPVKNFVAEVLATLRGGQNEVEAARLTNIPTRGDNEVEMR